MAKKNIQKVIDDGTLTDKERLVAEFRFKELQQYERLFIRQSILSLMLLSSFVSFFYAFAIKSPLFAGVIESYSSNWRGLISVAVLLFLGSLTIVNSNDQVGAYCCDMYTGLCNSIKNGTVLDFKFKNPRFYEIYRYKPIYD